MRCHGLVTLVLLLLVTKEAVDGTRTVDKRLEQLEHFLKEYITDLKYIEQKEEEAGVTQSVETEETTVNDDPFIAACEALVNPNLILSTDSEDLLEGWNTCYGKWQARIAYAYWDYETNLTKSNAKKLSDLQVKMSTWGRKLSTAAKDFQNSDVYNTLDDDDLKRQTRLLAKSSDLSDPADVRRLSEVGNQLQRIYSEATVDGLKLEPGLTKIMSKSRNATQLLHVWKEWRSATGPPMRPLYEEFVQLLNKAAKENNFDNYASLWIDGQFDQTDNLEAQAADRWAELEPLYQQLHAFVRHRLSSVYPEYKKLFDRGVIPSHILGNMNAQEWTSIYDLVKPYPDIKEPDNDVELQNQNYTVNSLFSTAEEFYTSIGLSPMTSKFKQYSMKKRPDDGREVVCHASASDFYTKDDFRIKMCTEVNMQYFETIHHEMGHIEYFMQYAKQPTVYRTGANSAFHEAIGDTISLSAMSRSHMETLNLAGSRQRDMGRLTRKKQKINFLLNRALFKVAFLPFGYMIDKWRWDVFKGVVGSDQYNEHWWKLRLRYQGIEPPVPRDESDFDPGSKFHIPSNSPYICYFFSFISQFQFYEAMCDASNHKGELHDCDFYQSLEAGSKLKSMMELGLSKPWPEAMKVMTGSSEMSSSSILKYFQPLQHWLELENKRTGATVGWDGNSNERRHHKPIN